jgi:hypothetical protein
MGVAPCPAPAEASRLAAAGRSAVATISRPIRPPAHLPPARLPQPYATDREAAAQVWREPDADTYEAPDFAGSTGAFSMWMPRARRDGTGARAELAARVARAQAIGAVMVSLVAAVLALGDQPGAPWALVLAILIGAGALVAYLLLQRREGHPSAGVVLLGSQLGIFVWVLALVGARPVLLALVPTLVVLAVLLSGRGLALSTAAAAVALYLAGPTVLVQLGIWPALAMSGPAQTLLDPGLATGGLLVSLIAVLALHATQLRTYRLAERRRWDARDLLAGYTLLQKSVRRDATRLEATLAMALQGERVELVAPRVADPALYQLAGLLDLATARLETLHRDREDRVRLEGAARRLARAIDHLERGSLPAWPGPSATLIDPLVAGLRRLHPDLAPAPDRERRLRGAGTGRTLTSALTSARSRRTGPTRGRTTGIILAWRPSRSPGQRELAETTTNGERSVWPALGADDDGGAPA